MGAFDVFFELVQKEFYANLGNLVAGTLWYHEKSPNLQSGPESPPKELGPAAATIGTSLWIENRLG